MINTQRCTVYHEHLLYHMERGIVLKTVHRAKFKSKNKKVNTIKFKKYCLSCYEDKRWVCQERISSYANGHYRARLTVKSQID